MNPQRRKTLKTLGYSTLGLGLVQFQASAQPAPVEIGPLSRLEREYSHLTFDYGGKKALLVRVPKPEKANPHIVETKAGRTSYYLSAYERVCTHQGCTPALPDAQQRMECPCHGSVFSAADGTVLGGPAAQPLRAIKLAVKAESVWATGYWE